MDLRTAKRLPVFSITPLDLCLHIITFIIVIPLFLTFDFFSSTKLITINRALPVQAWEKVSLLGIPVAIAFIYLKSMTDRRIEIGALLLMFLLLFGGAFFTYWCYVVYRIADARQRRIQLFFLLLFSVVFALIPIVFLSGLKY
jgi:hypothetical protein